LRSFSPAVPENRTGEIHRRNETGDLVFGKTLLQGDELTSDFLPEFSVLVDSLFV
jgi:hypothetical protein